MMTITMNYTFGFVLSVLISTVTARTFLNISGDIVLGALFPIHKKGSNGENCGKIQMEDGVQPLEAMLYALQRINQDPTILPGVRLGALVFDSCDNPPYALEQALNFVKGFIAHSNEYHTQEFQCSDQSVPKFLGGGFDKVVAVLAEQSSSVTIQVASVLRLFSVPQISYMATTPSLSNKERFPHFFRTVPSDVNQAHAMLEILKQFDWTYVSVVYSDTEYGNHGYETLVSLASNYSICFSTPQRIDKELFTADDYDNVIRTISNKTDVRVLFAEKTTTLRVLEAAWRLGVGTRFIWIGSDSWSTSHHREFLNLGFEHQVREMSVLEGALAVQPLSKLIAGFDDYFTGLGLEHRRVNPWFGEYWREYHGCAGNLTDVGQQRRTGSPIYEDVDGSREKLAEGSPRKIGVGSKGRRPEDMATVRDRNYRVYERRAEEPLSEECADPSLKISPVTGYKQPKFLHFIRDAVYAVAHALHDLQREKCGEGYAGMCPEMRHIDGDTLARYLSNVTFRDEAGKKFRFLNGVDGPLRYSILNYQKFPDGTYHWTVVGNYTENDNGKPVLRIDTRAMKYRNQAERGRRFFPNSTCAQPCRPNQVKVREKREPCCWRCRNCGLYQYKFDENRCEDCDWGTKPSADGTGCASIAEEFIDYSNPWAVGAMAVATCGIILTFFVWAVFVLYSKTPVIKASGRELSFLLLLGTLASFLMTFAIVAEPSTESCAVTRFGIGLCYTLCYAALVTKTNRIHRIFNCSAHSPHEPRYTSPKSQLLITGMLTLVEVVINASWLTMVPPIVAHTYPTRDTRLRICRGLDDRSYMVGLIYPFILIVVCTIYAVKTRKCPEGFNETRHIAFTNYTTIILWLAFVPLYLASTSNAMRVVTLALSLSLAGLVQLGCLFFPKIYIVLMKPEKNTKELVMAQHRTSSYLPTPTATPIVVLNGSSSPALLNLGSSLTEDNATDRPEKDSAIALQIRTM